MSSFEPKRFQDEAGQTMAEYGLVLTVITAGVVLVIAGLAEAIIGSIERVIEIIP